MSFAESLELLNLLNRFMMLTINIIEKRQTEMHLIFIIT